VVLKCCLMGTHPHVVCRATKGQQAFSDFWKSVNWGFGRTPAERRTAYLHLFASPLADEVGQRRADLVRGPFIGDGEWVAVRLVVSGLSPPS